MTAAALIPGAGDRLPGGPTWRLQDHETLPSTSDLCIELARAGEPAGLAVLARSQTRGRGTRGRGWMSGAGALALSVLLRPQEGDASRASVWPFVASLALHDAFALTPRHRQSLRLKWPNDVMLADTGEAGSSAATALPARKLAGILIERSPSSADDAGWLVLGFGANLASAPILTDRSTGCLAELGAAPDPRLIAERLLAALSGRIEEMQRGGFAAIRQAWLDRAFPAGTALAVRTPAGETLGAFSSIAEDGTLLLRVGGAISRISTGEVMLAGAGASS
ncbi:biotin--[acetyl-CoA-carboxylase] ligase [Lichenicoccus roseus]|uniref:biotin--[acetyl-CoA-carboxylase] ligase n=1 Tax=Lichenicoccus roseus TaxID=2683649 RepID=UPI001F0DFC4D|nr:biotin--[acetyl-CoA-carboxylase] ligase [Lichenicoccus roseus]